LVPRLSCPVLAELRFDLRIRSSTWQYCASSEGKDKPVAGALR
jgi:hypothetical protein